MVLEVEEAAERQPAGAPAAAAVAVVAKELGCAAAPDVCVAPHAPFYLFL